MSKSERRANAKLRRGWPEKSAERNERAGCGKLGLTGFEPVTLRLSSACSNQLSYKPWAGGCAVEVRGLEPLTYSLQSYRSTS